MSDTAEAAQIEAAEAPDWSVLATPDLGHDLDDVFAEDDAAFDFAATPEPLEDAAAIDRRLSTLARAERRLAEYDATAQQRLAELEDRITRGRAPLAGRVDWYRQSLELTHRSLIGKDKTRTRITLGAGVLSSTAQQPEWEYPKPGSAEEAELVAWCKEHLPAAYTEPKAPDPRLVKDELKKATKARTLHKVDGVTVPIREDGSVVTDAGEVVPHVKVSGRGRKFEPKATGADA